MPLLHEIARTWDALWWWFLHATGADNPAGPQYGFWSGFGSDIAEVAILGGLVHFARGANCHVKGCWRFSRHTVGPFRVCRKHHPGISNAQVSQQDVVDAHEASKA